MEPKAQPVNPSLTEWNPENGNFSFKSIVHMHKGGYSLPDAMLRTPICGLKSGEGKPLTEVEKNVLEQTLLLTSQACESLPGGLDAICDLMSYADPDEISEHTMRRLGFFLRDIIGTMAHLNTVESNCYYALLSNERLKNKGGRDE